MSDESNMVRVKQVRNVQITSSEFRALLDWRMATGFIPEHVSEGYLNEFMDKAAAEFGHAKWEDAYHNKTIR